MLAVNQYGTLVYIPGKHPRKELLEKLRASHAAKMYGDKKDGTTVHIGYVIRGEWFTLYREVENIV